MKGDRTRMPSGKLRQKRSDALVSTLREKYGEFCRVPVEATLGMIRTLTGLVGLNAIRQYIRIHGGV
jgi:hypothetical protein